jgi:hypothetical protein
LHEHLQQRIFAAVEGGVDCRQKDFTDMVMIAGRDSILQERKPWVQTALFNDRSWYRQVRDAAVEESIVTFM